MSRITYRVDEQDPPALGTLGERRTRGVAPAATALTGVHVPLAISLSVSALFFVTYWVPEFGRFWGYDLVLGQLSPLAAKELTSQSVPLVPQQAGHRGWVAGYLLLASLTLPVLARSRNWLLRLALWPVTYLALIGGLVSVLGLAVRGDLGDSTLGVVGMAAWLVAAVIITWRSLWIDPDLLPPRRGGLGWLLAAYALLLPVPVAVGRWLFAPELRPAALEVGGGGFAVRWAALITPATLPLYLAGVLLGLLAVLGHRLVSPARAPRTVGTALGAASAGVALMLCGAWASARGAERATEITMGSPADTLSFTCGSWVTRSAGRPAMSVIATGATCRRLTSYTGYRQTATLELDDSPSPLSRVGTPEGRGISSRLVAARYRSVLVLATTDRFDNRPDAVVGVATGEVAELWRFRCRDARPLTIRFAGSDAGDDPAAGRLTGPGEGSVVVVGCAAGTVRLNPQTGRTV